MASGICGRGIGARKGELAAGLLLADVDGMNAMMTRWGCR